VLALMLVPMLGVAAGRMDEAERVVSDMEAKAVRWNAALGARLPAFLASCFLSLSSPRHSPVATHARSSGCAPPTPLASPCYSCWVSRFN
jgi:hypothetical protein